MLIQVPCAWWRWSITSDHLQREEGHVIQSRSVIFLWPWFFCAHGRRWEGWIGIDGVALQGSLQSRPSYDSVIRAFQKCSLQFKLHHFTQAISLNSLFFFPPPARGRWEEAIVPQLLPISHWLMFKYKEKSAKYRICEGGDRNLKRNHGNVWNKSAIIHCGLHFSISSV